MGSVRKGACWGAGIWLLVGCAPHTMSGAYIARGQQFVELLQITQSQDGQLLGTLNHTGIKSGGDIEQFTLNISGTTDGHSLTLIGKVNEPFAAPTSMSGTMDGSVITITQPNGIENFSKANAIDYQADIQQLDAQAATVRQQLANQQRQQQAAAQAKAAEDASFQRISNINEAAGSLADELNEYAAKIQVHQDKNKQMLSAFHEAHSKALARAQHGWEIEQRYPKGSLQAGQVYLEINQVALNHSTYDLSWQQSVETAHTHIQQLDAAISNSPCHQQGPKLTLSNCETKEPAAINAYKAVRPMVLGIALEVSTTINSDAATMKNLVAQANAYAN